MKKSLLITILIIITVCAVALTGCGGGTPVQKKLGNGAPWISYRNQKEVSTYDVVNTKDNSVINGTYTIEIAKHNGTNITVANKEITNFKGYLAIGTLIMENGDTITSKVATETTMRVKLAEGFSKIGDKTTSYFADYGKKAVDYTVKENDEIISEDSIKIKDFYAKPFADNALLYLLARCLPEGGVQFGIYLPNFETAKLDQVIINRSVSNLDHKIGDVTYKTSLIEIAYNRTFPGIGDPIKAYVSDSAILGMDVTESTTENAVLKPILQIIEGNTTYTLKDTRVVSF